MIDIAATITTNPARPIVIGDTRLFRIGSYLIRFPGFRLGVGYCVDDDQGWHDAAREYARMKFVRAWKRYLAVDRLLPGAEHLAAEMDRMEQSIREAGMREDFTRQIVQEIRSLRAAGHDPATVMLAVLGAINGAAFPAEAA